MDVERQIRNALEARFEKLAPTELKNISVPMDLFRIVLPWERRAQVVRPPPTAPTKPTASKPLTRAIAVIVLLLIGVGWWWTPRKPLPVRGQSLIGASDQPAKIPEKSIAVLPFENLSDEKQNEYFADGVQDEILTRLAKVADLKVISRTSTQRFKSSPGRSAADREAARRHQHSRRKCAEERLIRCA